MIGVYGEGIKEELIDMKCKNRDLDDAIMLNQKENKKALTKRITSLIKAKASWIWDNSHEQIRK